MIAEEEISMGMVVMDIKGVIEGTTGEAKEVTIKSDHRKRDLHRDNHQRSNISGHHLVNGPYIYYWIVGAEDYLHRNRSRD